MAKLKLSPPWAIRATEIEQMFKFDSEVHVVYDEDECIVKVYVDNSEKAEALGRILIPEYDFGNVTLRVVVIPANTAVRSCAVTNSNASLFIAAFMDNPICSFIKTIHGIFPNDLTYVVFKNCVVQYFNDSLSDVYGQASTLYQNIASEIFKNNEGVFFCTDKPKT